MIHATQARFFVAAPEQVRAPVRTVGVDQAELAVRVAKRPAQRRVFRIAMVLPEVVHVDVGPAMVNEPALHHCVRSTLDPVFRNRVGETIPTVPAHRRRQRNLVADDDAKFFYAIRR